MTTDEALDLALEACPFCGGEAEYQKENVRSGYGEYERNETYHTIRCKKCGSSSKRVHQKHLIDFTKYTVRDFRENPILRAKVEDDYDAYCEQSRQLAIDAWSLRTAIKQARSAPVEPCNPAEDGVCESVECCKQPAPVQEPVAWLTEERYAQLHTAQRQRVVFPTMLRKMWSGAEVQAWLDENVNKENT